MSPKRAARKPAKGYAYASEDEIDTLLGRSPGVVLPAVPIANSWNYGAQTTSALPRQIPVNPNISPDRMARRIEAGIEIAQTRESPSSRSPGQDDQSPKKQQKTRPTRQPAVNSGSPARRRTKREPTPDQTQLLQSLREATVSPARGDHEQPSDATPPPPVPHAVSTDSSPDTQPPLQRRLSMMSNEPLYPSPLQRAGDHRHDAPVGSTPDRHSSVDNASEVSWNLERDIHEDDLQRTRPRKYRGEPHGRNITAPPRRPSGLAIVQETIEEEEEPMSEQADEPEPIVEPALDPAPETWTAPARTIIPQFFRRSESAAHTPDPVSPKESLIKPWLSAMRSGNRDNQLPEPSRVNCLRAAVALLLSLVLVFSFQSGLIAKLRSSFPLGGSSLALPPNITESEVFYGLQNQMSKVHAQVSYLSRELSSVRSEHASDPRPTYVVDPIAMPPRPVPKVNFLSPTLGAVVDPRDTTPTTGRKHQWWKRPLIWINEYFRDVRPPPPPAEALTSWEDAGHCWCSTPRKGVSQLSVFLNSAIVPEEVMVEHMPVGATLDPGAAPKEIEVWARYRIVPMDPPPNEAPAKSSWIPWSSTKKPRPIEPPSARDKGLGGYNIPGVNSLHDVLINTLRVSHAFEDESAYSDDPILEPNFYRIGKMVYDIHKEDYVQRFSLNTVIDIPTIRVDKVVFRVTSNWGSNVTCIYRLRLHGHV